MNAETGKTALITGASSGIGQELAKLFAQDGYNLVLVGRSEDKLDRLSEVFKSNYGTQQILVINKDLSEEDAAQDIYNQVQEAGITVNVLVNDAGASTYGLFATETNWEREKQIIHLNVLTTTLLTKLFLKDMVARNEGRILQLASLVAVTPFPLMAVYAATKAYIWNLTQSLINEIKDSNVTMTALMPNATATNFFREAGAPKLTVEDTMDDPAMVAKDAYKALMKGEAKVIPGGVSNKAQEVMAYVSPQETLAAMMRRLLTPKDESGQEKTPVWTIVGVAAAVVAGIALVSAFNNMDPVDKARYRYKAGKLKSKATGLIDEAGDALSEAKDTAADKWSDLGQMAGRAIANVFG
ncbi:SDR family NAD(P)-dependent oxidoreductase [Spirosoma taeanense]|uniref:SDR family NAD(P)-dependent oxidoreductase n=1 Tax=Spirosoma taeanense TaxID=2735870 RepID=A0A6M5Y7L7_9BACT|nr:SDR family NAD(P)-dependent oxidoreductase [Spirosoma taeanense]QJW89484.1 SDR family NAD(P)-dependent oxidoreductase [Spirosoma taeanense]